MYQAVAVCVAQHDRRRSSRRAQPHQTTTVVAYHDHRIGTRFAPNANAACGHLRERALAIARESDRAALPANADPRALLLGAASLKVAEPRGAPGASGDPLCVWLTGPVEHRDTARVRERLHRQGGLAFLVRDDDAGGSDDELTDGLLRANPNGRRGD